MEQEEKVMFLYIKRIVTAKTSNQPLIKVGAENLSDLINELEKDHDLVGRAMEEIRVRSNNYAIPDDACASYSVLYKMLEEFESDLFTHIHLENNILFPKAVEMEKTLV